MLGHPSVTSTEETRAMAENLQGRVWMYNADLWCGDCIRSMVARALTRDWEHVEATDDTPPHFWNPNTDACFDYEGNLTDGSHAKEEPWPPIAGNWEIVGTDTDTFPSNVDHLSSESDSPNHCAGCQTFLENDLTRDGEEYTHQAINEARKDGKKDSVALTVWEPFYKLEESHDFGPVEEARFTGNPHRKCRTCDTVTLDLEG